MDYEEANEPVLLSYDEILTETDLAYLFVIDGEEFWIPKSQIEYLDTEEQEFDIPRWLAEEKGLY